MSKKSRNKQRNREVNKGAKQHEIRQYIQMFPLSCKGKSLKEIISDYAQIMKKSENDYKKHYTEIELKSTILL